MKETQQLFPAPRKRWLIDQTFGKTHWCTAWVNALCDANPEFITHLSEQTAAYVHYLCLVRLKWPDHVDSTPAVSEQVEILLHETRKKVLARLYQPCPPGLLNILSRFGTRPLTRLDYSRFLDAMADPEARQFLQHTRHLKAYHLQWLEEYPCDLLHWRVLQSVKKSENYTKLKYIVNVVKKLAADETNRDQLISIRRLRTLETLESWLNHHVMSLSFPPPPWSGNHWIKPVMTVAELKQTSLRFKNCSYDYRRQALLGDYYFYTTEMGPAIIGVRRDPIIGWQISAINGVNNTSPDKSIVDKIREALGDIFCADNIEVPDSLWDDFALF